VLVTEHRVEAARDPAHPSTCQVNRRDDADGDRDGRVVRALIHRRAEGVPHGVDELRLDGARLERIDGVVDHPFGSDEAEQPVRECTGGEEPEDRVVGERRSVVAAAAEQEADRALKAGAEGAAPHAWPRLGCPLDASFMLHQ